MGQPDRFPSGCWRQTVVDTLSIDYHMGCIEDCITHHTTPPRKIGMMDMWVKYGCPITLDQTTGYFKCLEGDVA